MVYTHLATPTEPILLAMSGTRATVLVALRGSRPQAYEVDFRGLWQDIVFEHELDAVED